MKKTITVFDLERYDGEWPPEDAGVCLAWFSAKIASIPAEFRSTARIEFESASGYEGCHYAEIKITYERSETKEEIEARKSEAARRIEENKAFHRAQLARLESEAKTGDEQK
jgi:hypothetical protein